MRNRTFVAATCLIVSALQAWDSHALLAEGFVQALIACASVLTPIAVLATRDTRIHLAAVASSAVLLIAARLVSSVAMNGLVLAAVFPAVFVMFDHARSLARGEARL